MLTTLYTRGQQTSSVNREIFFICMPNDLILWSKWYRSQLFNSALIGKQLQTIYIWMGTNVFQQNFYKTRWPARFVPWAIILLPLDDIIKSYSDWLIERNVISYSWRVDANILNKSIKCSIQNEIIFKQPCKN